MTRRAASGRPSSARSTWSGISLRRRGADRRAGGVYLNEYARDNWFNRIVNLAVVNLAGVPSIVHALFGLGAFVLFAARFGYSILAASLTLAIMTLPVIIASTREALAAVPMAFREACWNVGATRWQTIRARRAAQLDQRHPDRRHPAGQPRGRRDGADHVHRAPSSSRRSRAGDLFPYALGDQCMALSMHLYTLATQVPERARRRCRTRTAVVLLGLGAAGQRDRHRAARAACASRKKW